MVSNMGLVRHDGKKGEKQFSAGGQQGGLACGSFADADAASGSGLWSLKLKS